MTSERERSDGPARPEKGFERPEKGFGWEEDPEPDWVDGIREARRRRAKRVAELLSKPEGSSEPEDPPP
jgi:hypothetical protein